MSGYYHNLIKAKEKKFYSLNFIFAKFHEHIKTDDSSIEISEITSFSDKMNNKNIIVGAFYKNVSTIFHIDDNNEF